MPHAIAISTFLDQIWCSTFLLIFAICTNNEHKMVPLADDLVSFDYILLNQTPDKTSLDWAIFTRTLTAWNLCGWLWPLWHLVLCISQFVFFRVCRLDSVLYHNYLCFCEALQALGQFLTFSLDLRFFHFLIQSFRWIQVLKWLTPCHENRCAAKNAMFWITQEFTCTMWRLQP